MSSSSISANTQNVVAYAINPPPSYVKSNDSSMKCTSQPNLPASLINPSVGFPLPMHKYTKLRKRDTENTRELSFTNYICRLLSMLPFPQLWFAMLKSKLSILFRYNKKKYQEIMSEKAAFAAGKRKRKMKKFRN